MTLVIPGYELYEEIGHGGMARVYRAHQSSFDCEVAVKVLDPALVNLEELGERFLKEARIMRRLRHSNICSVYDVGAHETTYFIAMEFLSGGSLKDRMSKKCTLSFATNTVTQIGAALDYAHGQGYVHRDIKPGNILFRDNNHAVLTDFGIARVMDSATRMTRTGLMLGTPYYMSPEQAQAQTVDGRSDIYALGVMFYQMLTGELPFTGATDVSVGIKHISEPIPVLGDQLIEYQPVINRVLAKSPDDRYQTCEEFIDAVESVSFRDKTMVLNPVRRLEEHFSTGSRASTPQQQIPAHNPQSSQSSVFSLSQPSLVRSSAKRQLPMSMLYAVVGVIMLIGTVSLAAYFLVEDNSYSPVQSKKIADLLDEAAEATTTNDYRMAENYYRDVLAIDINNAAARDGFERLGSLYIERIERALDNRDIDTAKEDLNDLVRVSPSHKALPSVQQKIRDIIAIIELDEERAVQLKRKIEEFLSAADSAYLEKKLTAPAGDNALEKYRSVLQLDSKNKKALAGIKNIANSLLQIAEQAFYEGDKISALTNLKLAKQIAPDHHRVLELKNLIETTADSNNFSGASGS